MQRLDGLQALRGVAATMVVLDHAMRAAILQGHTFVGLEDLAGTVGRIGVNVFFILSGFIMTYTTRDITTLSPAMRARTFLHRRARRLVPLYWLATVLTLVVGTIEGTGYRLDSIVTSLLFLPNVTDVFDWRMPPILGVGWTLNYESLFYGIFALSLLFPRRIGLGLCVAMIAVLVGGGSWVTHHVPDEPWHRLLAFYTFRNMAYFAIGILLAIALRTAPQSRSARPLWGALVLILAAIAIYFILGFAEGSTTWSVVSALCCTTTVALAARSASLPQTVLSRTLLHLGDASFSIYLFHALIMERLARIIGANMTIVGGCVFVTASTLSCLLLGSAIHSAIEIPIGKRLRHFVPRRSGSGRRPFRWQNYPRAERL